MKVLQGQNILYAKSLPAVDNKLKHKWGVIHHFLLLIINENTHGV